MKRITIFIVVVLIASFFHSSVNAQVEKSHQALGDAIDKAIDSAIEDQRLVGGMFLVAQDGKIIYSRAAGFADRESKKPIQKDTIFRLASVSKVYTTMAIAALIEQGKIKLDDPVTKFLPEFTPTLPNGEKPVITIRQLLSHTSGLNYGFSEPENGPYHQAGVSDGLDDTDLTLDENLRRLASVPLLFEPGSDWNYSLATDVLGAVVGKASGKTFQESMNELVAKPLGMQDSTFVVADRSRLATPYYNATPTPKRMNAKKDTVSLFGAQIVFSPHRAFDKNAYPSGGGGMSATATDLLLLLEAIRKGGMPLVNSTLMDEMCRNQLPKGSATPEAGVGFGLGWAVLLDPEIAKSPQSEGTIYWGGVYGNSWFVDRQNRLTVIILTNTAFEGMSGQLTNDIRDAVYANINQSQEKENMPFYKFVVKDINGKDFSFEQLKGKKVMIVNVASKCGLTTQYKELQALYEKYSGDGKELKEKDFVIIGFPANDFGKQEPGTNEEIKSFCTTNYGVTFPMMSKITVKGDEIHPLYQWLTQKELNGVKDAPVEWNFQKSLIDEQGNFVDMVPPKEKPDSEKIINWLEDKEISPTNSQ